MRPLEGLPGDRPRPVPRRRDWPERPGRVESASVPRCDFGESLWPELRGRLRATLATRPRLRRHPPFGDRTGPRCRSRPASPRRRRWRLRLRV